MGSAVNLAEALSSFGDTWAARTVAVVNDYDRRNCPPPPPISICGSPASLTYPGGARGTARRALPLAVGQQHSRG